MIIFGRILALVISLIVVIIFSVHPQHAPVKPNFSFPEFFGVLGSLFIIVLLVERATEIVIAILRQSKSDKIKADIERKDKQDPSSTVLTELREELADYQAQTKALALGVGFSLAVLVCGAGVGMLESILVTPSNPHFMRGVDILLTAGLIAGGSDSFHQFVRALETFFGELKEQMKKP